MALIGGADDEGEGGARGVGQGGGCSLYPASAPTFTSLREDNYSGPHASSLPHSSAAPGWRRHELKLFFDCVRVFVLEMRGGGEGRVLYPDTNMPRLSGEAAAWGNFKE